MMNYCSECPRKCNADRGPESERLGICGSPNKILITRAALHFWEEPCLSGEEGSGTVFFSGCNLHCVYCQNRDISGGAVGREVSEEALAEEFLHLQDMGANNINLVTPSHYYLQIKRSLEIARKDLHIPVISNTSSYDSVETLKEMEGLIDIWLADYKYDTPEIAARYSKAYDYPEVAKRAIAEMYKQSGAPEFDERGMMRKGIIVRQLLLPGHVKESKACVKYIYDTYKDNVYLSLMSQYTPFNIPEEYKEINRKCTKREYEKLVSYAVELGVVNAFIQEGDVAKESFIPKFDTELTHI